MPVYIALLRGINVGQKKVNMNDLKALLSAHGLTDIVTYIQSGNVLFNYRKTTAPKLEEKLSTLITDHYGFEVPVMIRTPDELVAALDHNPFLKDEQIDVAKLHLTFLAAVPEPEHLAKIRTYHYPPDQFHIQDKDVYLHCPDGYGNTKLSNTFFEQKLKVAATTRNLKTVRELIRLAGSV